MAPTKDYWADLGLARATEYMQKWIAPGARQRTIDPLIGCWLYNSASTNTGYRSIRTWSNSQIASGSKIRNTPPNFSVHRIAFLWFHQRDLRPELESSHICATRNCFNPEHVMEETKRLNHQRRGCMGVLRCPDHDHLVYDECSHDPQCLRRPPPSFSCCLSAQENADDLALVWSFPGSLMERIRKSPVLDGEVQGSNPKIMLGADKLTPAEDFEGMNGLVDVDDDDDNEYQKLLKKPSPVLKGGLQTTTLPLHPDSRVETSFFGNDRFLDSPGQLTTEASGRKRRRRRQRQIRHRGFQFQLDSKAPKKTSR